MKQAADRITRYVGERTFDDFINDDYFRSAVERQFEIVGEAILRLRKLAPELASRISNQNKIAGFRNILVHDYDGVDYTITWNVILHHLPILHRELDELLSL